MILPGAGERAAHVNHIKAARGAILAAITAGEQLARTCTTPDSIDRAYRQRMALKRIVAKLAELGQPPVIQHH